MSKTTDKPTPEQPDPLAEMIVDLHERVARLEGANHAHKYWLQTLADEVGYEMVAEDHGELGKRLAWKRKSKLVTL